MQQGVQTDAICNIQQCCVCLHGAKSLTGFKLCAATPNNMQQGVQTDATCQHPAMLGVVGQQCRVRLHRALASEVSVNEVVHTNMVTMVIILLFCVPIWSPWLSFSFSYFVYQYGHHGYHSPILCTNMVTMVIILLLCVPIWSPWPVVKAIKIFPETFRCERGLSS